MQSARSVRNIVLHSVCTHRRHLRLDNLRTLILANNQLMRIQLTTDDDGDNICVTDDEDSERVIIIMLSLTSANYLLLNLLELYYRKSKIDFSKFINAGCE